MEAISFSSCSRISIGCARLVDFACTIWCILRIDFFVAFLKVALVCRRCLSQSSIELFTMGQTCGLIILSWSWFTIHSVPPCRGEWFTDLFTAEEFWFLSSPLFQGQRDQFGHWITSWITSRSLGLAFVQRWPYGEHVEEEHLAFEEAQFETHTFVL